MEVFLIMACILFCSFFSVFVPQDDDRKGGDEYEKLTQIMD